MLKEIFNRIKFWNTSDRIGPDIPTNHWKLYFKSTMSKLCKKKFKYFHDTAEFRPGAYAVFCSKISIGKNVIIRPATMLFADIDPDGQIIIEDDVMIASGVHIYVTKHSFEDSNTPLIDQGYCKSKPVILKKGCWIGANSIILPGVTIGENAVIGAGSVVTKNIPSKTIAVGNPCKVIKLIAKN